MTKPALNLAHYHWRQQHGDITIYGTWYGENLRPCLVLIPTYKRKGQGQWGPCVVLVDDAHLWAVDTGSPFYVQQHAVKFAMSLGFEPSPQLCARIANLIDEHIGDLLTIPPKPAERHVVADAIITSESGQQRHIEITDHA